ncbi:AMP-binding protein [Mariniluteicoccus flavus]
MPITALPVDDPGFLDALAAALDGGPTLAPLPTDARSADAVRAMLNADPDPDTPHPDHSHHPALIVATSGSTGAPKGVRLSARAVIASAEATHRRLGGAADWTLCLPLHYVAGAMVAARALTGGTRLHTAKPDLADLDVPSSPAYISLVPTQLTRALHDHGTTRALAAHGAVLLGGAAAAPELLDRARAQGINVVTTYGMSETAGGCVYDGVPLDATTVTLDPDTGRVDLTGPMAFSGYHGRPDLTTATLTGQTVHTRDRGRWDGERLTILGRLDDVVVTGGVNVDLAELERAVQQRFPHTAVVGVPDPEWGTRIVAAGPIPLPLKDFRAHLDVDGPARPRGLLRLDSLPLTSSGKIDRQAIVAAWRSAERDDNPAQAGDRETW